jgi:hypothetical protein
MLSSQPAADRGGEPGEIRIRGGGVSLGYVDRWLAAVVEDSEVAHESRSRM